jgi:hypothetical protein
MTRQVGDLISEYREHAVQHSVATESGEFEKGNEHHDMLFAVVRRLRTAGDDGNRALLTLLEDEAAGVRCWAATHCLIVDERRARQVLADLSYYQGIVGFNAQMVLSEWDNGSLEVL